MRVQKPIEKLIHELKERAKELNCLYQVQELLNAPGITIDEICQGIIRVLPPGWQYPDVCQAEIIHARKTFQSPGFQVTPWMLSADIMVQDQVVGRISVYYTEERPLSDEGPFLKEERKLIEAIAEQFGFTILHQQLRQVFQEQTNLVKEQKSEWKVILDLLRRTDPGLLMRLSRKMINYLGWSGVKEAELLLERFGPAHPANGDLPDANRPFSPQPSNGLPTMSEEVFTIASRYLSRALILDNLQKWIREDQSGFLIHVLANPGSSLAEISAAIERYHLLARQSLDLTESREKWFRVALIRRILSDQPEFIRVAKKYLAMDDFSDFMHRVIYPADSHGRLGGKSSGLFLAAQILKRSKRQTDLLNTVKTPKTWYLTSDAIFYFMNENNLEDILEQKYKELRQIRHEYPYIIHLFNNSRLPPQMAKGLSMALDDFGDVPLIVRSSSVLEDRTGAAFAGKYKSLFIANQGTKEERLAALINAITEVFASMFGPDPIEYRFEHSLLDNHEEMGIMIQEVVGTRAGDTYFPAFAGVAFSENEFRWSGRIKREDGLVRFVPGLGTRAVDRISDDYPILISPGQPRLRVNVTPEEIVRYSPKKMDVINLKTRTFETVEIPALLRECGRDYPLANQIFSLIKEDHLQQPGGMGIDFEKEEVVVTFDGLVNRSSFVGQIQAILSVLQEALGHPVDIEFAHDGTHFYLLQCRSQSYSEDFLPAVIPSEIPPERFLFSAHRYLTNGMILDITHVVYVDPQQYAELDDYQDLLAVGSAIGRLNQLLPKRQFILIGPGRWGSRGDIKLGVSVTYSDISNTAMLVEIARKQRGYQPEPSFGTHFFLDLVEASIRYLPLYPDDPETVFNETFFTQQRNLLPDLLPDFAYLGQVIRVVQVCEATGGLTLHVLMNAEINKAVAILAESQGMVELEQGKRTLESDTIPSDVHWRWRLQAAETIAAHLEPERFGVKGIYVFGSTKNATAGPASDIDLLIHFQGTPEQRQELLTWLEGWSLSLSEMNYQRTGFQTAGLLDIHLVTDEDIRRRTSYAVKIGAVSDAARPLLMGKAYNHLQTNTGD